jgi:hypothetical protein
MMKKETDILQNWTEYRTRPPTTTRILVRDGRTLAVRCILILLIAWALTRADLIPVAMLAAGMLAGSLLRDIQWIRKSVQMWPMLLKYLDWSKIETENKRLSNQASHAISEPAPGAASSSREG